MIVMTRLCATTETMIHNFKCLDVDSRLRFPGMSSREEKSVAAYKWRISFLSFSTHRLPAGCSVGRLLELYSSSCWKTRIVLLVRSLYISPHGNNKLPLPRDQTNTVFPESWSDRELSYSECLVVLTHESFFSNLLEFLELEQTTGFKSLR